MMILSVINLIKYPILTEKTIRLIQQNQYSFAVALKADKKSIKAAVEQLFDVKVIKKFRLRRLYFFEHCVHKLAKLIIYYSINKYHYHLKKVNF